MIQSPENVIVRPMMVDDIPAVRSIDRMSFALPWPESSYHYELSGNRTSHMLVAAAESGAEVVPIGYVGFWLIVDEAHISTLAVHPEWRDRGIGRLLLRCGLSLAASVGAQIATLEVRESNLKAIRLYREFGFEIVGRRPAYYKDNNEDAILMTLDEVRELTSQAEAGDR